MVTEIPTGTLPGQPVQPIMHLRGRMLGKGGFAAVYELQNMSDGVVLAGKVNPPVSPVGLSVYGCYPVLVSPDAQNCVQAVLTTSEQNRELQSQALTRCLQVISKESLQKSRARQKLETEISIHRRLKHPNIVRFLRSFEDSTNVYLLLECCTGRTLADLLRSRSNLMEAEVANLMTQTIIAVQSLHDERIIHRDLKLSNLFLDKEGRIKASITSHLAPALIPSALASSHPRTPPSYVSGCLFVY